MMFILIIITLILFYDNRINGVLVNLTPNVAKMCMKMMKSPKKSYNSSACGFPLVGETESITFVTLEGSFPFNAPYNISKGAGPQFRQGTAIHGGIGIVISNTTRNGIITSTKISVEFAAENYLSGLFPNTNNDTLTWNNTGSIFVNSPLNTSLWLNSRIISETSGYVYLRYIYELYKNISTHQYAVFQPIKVIQPNVTYFQSILPVNEKEIGNVVVNPNSSYAFVITTIEFLLNLNCEVDVVLGLTATSIFYLQDETNLGIVYLDSSSNVAQVSKWYRQLYYCFSNLSSNSLRTNLYLDIQDCYGRHSYAYVYLSNSSVYNVSLLNTDTLVNQGVYNPMIFQYLLVAETNYNLQKPNTNTIDIILIVLFYMSILAMVVFIMAKVYYKRESKTSKQSTYLERFHDKVQESMASSVIEIIPLHKDRISDMNHRID